MPAQRAAPSPALPLLVLGILGFLLMASTYWRFARQELSMMTTSRSTTINKTSPMSVIVPIVLLAVFVQAFGIAHQQDAPSPLLALLDSLLHNSTFPMFITIVLILLLLAGLTVGVGRPVQVHHSSAAVCSFQGNRWYCY